MPQPGIVSFVGAGPGDPGLLTLEGARRLKRADVVLHDYLANEALLDLAPQVAERVCLGRHGEGKLWRQTEINERIVADALAGKAVVRLKGGDPSVFGRLAEELDACREAGVPVAIVPGVTTAVAAAAYAGVTVTNRDHASAVALVTGHAREDGKTGVAGLDFAQLADFPGTLVVYMGVTTAPQWSRRLIEAGKAPETPALIVRRATMPDQETIACTLGELATVLAPGRIRPPLVVVVGEVTADPLAASWYTTRPLSGRTVLITRPRGQEATLRDRLVDLGAQPIVQPVIEIAPPPDSEALDGALNRLGDYAWVVFSSRNGVDAVMRRLGELGKDARAFGAARVATIGPATAEALAGWRLQSDLTPAAYRAEALAECLRPHVDGQRVLLIRASRGRETLAESLAAARASVEQVTSYESRDVEDADPRVLKQLAEGRVDWVTVTSSAIAHSAAKLFAEAIAGAPRPPKFAAISPLTAAALAESGVTADAVATDYTADGVVEAILAAESDG